MPTPEEVRKLAHQLSQKLADEGKIIEGGWMGYRVGVMNPGCSEIQVRETRLAFFAGAQHLFSSIMTILDAGTEPTDKDMHRISMIHSELEQFLVEFKRQHNIKDDYGPTKFQG